jgi:hypothetical protein
MTSPRNSSAEEQIPSWPVPISCLSRSWKMATGRIPRGFHSAADGAVIAPRRAMKRRFRRRMFCRRFVIWATPRIADGRRQSVAATRCGLRWQRPPRVPARQMQVPQKMRQREFFASRTFTNRLTVPRVRENWNSTSRQQPGSVATTIRVSRRWQSVFWKLT